MVGRAQSKTLQRLKSNRLTEKWIQRAKEHYNTSSATPLHDACEAAEKECWAEDKVRITLSRATLHRRVNGTRSQAEVNAEKNQHLSAEEVNQIIEYATELASRGWGLSLKHIKEHADEILRARLGPTFEGVGKNWAERFVERNCDRLKSYWTHSLDESRAQAANPHTKKAFFDLLEKTIQGEDGEDSIPDELIYGADETGFQKGIGTKQRVVGGTGKKVQHQVCSGDRENITVIETICADSTTIAPAVIYKGEGYQVKWKQENPLNAW